MKRTLLFVLALIAAGCADSIPRNLDELSRQGPQYLDPETLEPYSGPAYYTTAKVRAEKLLLKETAVGYAPTVLRFATAFDLATCQI